MFCCLSRDCVRDRRRRASANRSGSVLWHFQWQFLPTSRSCWLPSGGHLSMACCIARALCLVRRASRTSATRQEGGPQMSKDPIRLAMLRGTLVDGGLMMIGIAVGSGIEKLAQARSDVDSRRHLVRSGRDHAARAVAAASMAARAVRAARRPWDEPDQITALKDTRCSVNCTEADRIGLDNPDGCDQSR